jgi:hypothetical protein
VLAEEDGFEKAVHGDADATEQKQLHSHLLDEHLQEEKENTALEQVPTQPFCGCFSAVVR